MRQDDCFLGLDLSTQSLTAMVISLESGVVRQLSINPTDPASPIARYSGVDAHACDDEAAERLWAVSEELLARA